ncbi:Protein CBG13103 [Caenorhabditis briggsae]|uniref:Protein CBG13103 n=1 Tax=Caenorhabditis briggsae TaxID=6238 RepID=A8XH34_CAEBR|nr:Protein CBG13103 [Caenorhabditis briggsae]CAP31958.2 Protein CBG13103 [Caenorhabditis briggsae]
MERELRLKAFMEEYARIVQLFDDIVSMKESMGRLEKYMIIMVCQVLVALMARLHSYISPHPLLPHIPSTMMMILLLLKMMILKIQQSPHPTGVIHLQLSQFVPQY